jgi:type 1 fimbria pilin
MKISLLKLAAVSALLSLISSAMAGTNGGTIHFTGSIVESPCSTGSFSGGQLNLQCDRPSAFAVSFQRVGADANPAAAITLTRDGKPLGTAEATAYRMALRGHTQLGLSAKTPAAGATVSPVIMTVSYL